MGYLYADELEQEYRNDLKPLLARYEELKQERHKLFNELSKCEDRGEWERIPTIKAETHDIRVKMQKIGSVISSSRYSIQWLHDGKEPGARREISRRSCYQRTEYWGDIDRVAMDQLRFSYSELSEDDLQRLEDFLSLLSEREKEAVVSVIGKGNTYQETADYMRISRSSVQTLVNRGMKKLTKGKEKGVQIAFF